MGTFEDNNIPVNRDHGHDVMETIKIHIVLDGDLAATINNLALYAMNAGVIDEVIFCGHTAPKLAALLKTIQEKLDIENRVES